mmetsp:Transcript_6497/g.18619  ORF Transcript_6497/g.18619 Transcript_6497/m.18619 type:complete len:284 (+) Transcript_6497:1219-2070(+)
MPRVSLGVENQQLGQQVVSKGVAERGDLVSGTAAGTRGVRAGFVGKVHAVGGNLGLANAVDELDVGQESLQLRPNVFSIQRGPVKGRVGVLCRQQPGLDLKGIRRVPLSFQAAQFGFQHQSDSTGAHDHARSSLVKGQRRVLDDGLRGGRTERPESGSEPREQGFPGSVVPGHHHDAFGASRDEHVLRHGNGLGGPGAGRVGLRVGTPAARQLGELRVSEDQHAKEELAIKDVLLAGLLLLLILMLLLILSFHFPGPGHEPGKGGLVVLRELPIGGCPDHPAA